MPPLDPEQQRDIASLVHPYTELSRFRDSGPTVITHGKGVYVYDEHGRRYLEGLAGLWCTALGYGNEELIETAHEQLATLSFSHLFGGKSHEPAIQLAEKIKEIAPAPSSKVLFVGSGSEANDTQVKLAWYYNNACGRPEKKKIISRIKAYHGVTIASGSLTGLGNIHQDFDLPYGDRFLHTECPHHYRFAEPGEDERSFSARLADALDSMIQAQGPETVAAFIAEPVMGAGGVIVPPEGYFESIQGVLEMYGIPLIADEVITGFGRLGTWFGSQALGLRPSSVSIAKALTSAYAPLGAITIPEPVYEAMLEESRKIGAFAHGFTYGGHPLAAALGVKAIEIYERDDIIGQAALLAPHFQRRLKALSDHPLVGESRGMGLIGGVELVADKATKAPFDPALFVGVRTAALIQDEGLILRPIGDTLGICPPLIITEAQIDELFDCLARGLDKAEEMVRKEGLRPV